MPNRRSCVPGRAARPLLLCLLSWLATAAPGRAAAPADSLALAPALPAAAAPAARPYYFYRRLSYGSDAMVHPLRMILNSSYGIFQTGNRDRRPFAIDYRTGATNVWRNFTHPFSSIQAEGWWQFLKAEVIPISFKARGARYWPNYTQHLIGGGMNYRLYCEWYRAHEWPHPRWWAAGTMAIGHFLNEIVENDGYVGWSTDPVADLWLFDPAGILLFSSDRVSRFFGNTLHMSDWSYQPAYDPWNRTLENNGVNYAMKLWLSRHRRWSLFYHYGTHGELGLSRTWENGRCLSVGLGLMAGKLITLGEGVKTVDLVPSGGIFYDRNNSLLASLIYGATQNIHWRANVYPGLLRVAGWSPGLFTAIDYRGRLIGGVTVSSNLPLGLAF